MKQPSPAVIRIKGERGLATKLAKALKLDLSAISKWSRIPADHIVAVERISGIPREELRPDLYRKQK